MNEGQRDEGYWIKHKSSWESSGLSQRRYSAQAGFCHRKFNYHLKRIAQQADKTRFKFIEAPSSILATKPVVERGRIEVKLVNGVVVALALSAEITLAQVFKLAGAL